MARLRFVPDLLGRTFAYNSNDVELGFIEKTKVGRKTRYTFEGEEGIFLTADCLREIADELDRMEAGK